MASMLATRSSISRAIRVNVSRPRTCQPRRMVVVRAEAPGSVRDKVVEIIAKQLATEVAKLDDSAKFVDLGADSLDTVEIMMALEEEFDLQLNEEGAEKITTVGEAAQLIEAAVKAKA